jgi:hypothetical protein
MSNEDSNLGKVTGDGRAVLGCGVRALVMWIGAVVVIALMIGIGVWVSGWFSG